MPRTVFAGNWKMHKTGAATVQFIAAFLPQLDAIESDATIVLAPPFTALADARHALGSSRVALGAQNVHWEAQGAYTGEISIPMLQEYDVRYVIVGHSERREYFFELDRTVNLKVKALLAAGMTPIVAVGETLEERNDGRTDERVISQTREALAGIDNSAIAKIVMAYEPIWSIGTGRNCEASEANRVMGLIRASVAGLADVPILYGGSMKPENVASYMALPHINGGLVGGASLDATSFTTLIRNAHA